MTPHRREANEVTSADGGWRVLFAFVAQWPAASEPGVRPTTRMSKLLLTLPVVFGAQVAMEWFFYRSRVISHTPWTHSDLVVFGVPLLVGFAAAAFILFLSFPKIATLKRMLVTVGASATGAFISSFVGTLIAFNLYGT